MVICSENLTMDQSFVLEKALHGNFYSLIVLFVVEMLNAKQYC